MTPSAYPAARAAAGRIQSHFARHLAAQSLQPRGEAAALPDTAAIEAIIEAAFWASLRREEGYMPRISLAFVAPETVEWPLKFERRLPLAAQPLTRLAPAVERPGIHLGVWRDGEELFVWGSTRSLPAFCLVLEVIAPGLLVIKHSRGDGSEKFVNIAVLQGDEIKMIDEQSARLPDCPDLLTSLLGFDSQHASSESVSVLIHLSVSMRAHGRGGTLLVVPANTERWRESVAQPILYALVPPFSALAELMQDRAARNPDRRWVDARRRAVESVAGLTAVDGATVITDRYEVLAFGAKIVTVNQLGCIRVVPYGQTRDACHPEGVRHARKAGNRLFRRFCLRSCVPRGDPLAGWGVTDHERLGCAGQGTGVPNAAGAEARYAPLAPLPDAPTTAAGGSAERCRRRPAGPAVDATQAYHSRAGRPR